MHPQQQQQHGRQLMLCLRLLMQHMHQNRLMT
jgi:hypothetical protein